MFQTWQPDKVKVSVKETVRNKDERKEGKNDSDSAREGLKPTICSNQLSC